MRSEGAHLDREQMLLLMDEPEASRAAVQHLAECESCKKRLEVYQSVQKALIGLRETGSGSRGSKCPPEGEWLQVVAGLPSLAEAEKRLEHAAHCSHCGFLLRSVAEDFADEVTGDEEDVLAGLKSGSADWQREIVGKLSRTWHQVGSGHEARKPARFAKRTFIGWPRWGLASSILLIIAVFTSVFWWWRQPQASQAERLLAEAYTAQRTIELRIPGARYAELRLERGAERSRLNRPQALLEAEAAIARGLAAHPDDPKWLTARGTAELLEWQYEAAIKSFGRALEIQPGLSRLLVDLGTAYYERAKGQDRTQDYAEAAELFSQALARQPNNAVALFDRAVTYERILLYDEALTDWENYLRIDPHGEWADEARQRRDALVQKIRSHDRSDAMPLREPTAAELVLHARVAATKDSKDWPDSLDEAYLDVATTQWLAAHHFSHGSRSALLDSPAEREALSNLAQILRKYHGDLWLRDLLADNSLPHWAAAVRNLSAAVQSNAEGDPDQAIPLALLAEKQFRSARSAAGALRARLEYVIALKRGQHGNQCLATALNALRDLQNHRYPWIQAGILLETSTCYALVGNAGMARQFARRAVILTHETGYAYLHLRSLCYDDGVWGSALGVSSSEAWSRVHSGLLRFWDAPYQPLPGYEFYVDLGSLAEGAEFWHLAEAIGREAVSMASRTGDRAYQAVAHHWLAQVSKMAGDLRESEAQFDLASQLFATLPLTPTLRSNQAAMEIERASLEVQRGELDAALRRLLRVRGTLPEIANSFVSVLYYQWLGELCLLRGDIEKAERSLRSAVYISEVGLTSLTSDLERLFWDLEAGRAYRDLVELYFRRYGDSARALEFWEWYRGAPLRSQPQKARVARIDFSALDTDPPLPSVPAHPSFLPSLPEETILSFASFPTGLVVWAYDNRGIQASWVAVPSDKLNQVARRFAGLCADRSSPLVLLRRDGRRLFDWLVGPVATRLDPGRTLVVEPDGALIQIPFQALVDPQGQYFGRHFSIVESPGLAYQQRLRPRVAISRMQKALVVGNGSPDSEMTAEFPPLPDADLEARQVAARFDQPRLLIGRQATLGRLQRDLPHAEVFHFAGHAVSGGLHPGLFLAAPRFAREGERVPPMLDAVKLGPEQLRHAQLVVLSACDTGLAEKGLVDPDSLVRAFLRGGVPHVIATKWRVDSRTTSKMIDLFYSNLLQGRSVAAALHAAAEGIRSLPDTSHPYFWAAFAEFGR